MSIYGHKEQKKPFIPTSENVHSRIFCNFGLRIIITWIKVRIQLLLIRLSLFLQDYIFNVDVYKEQKKPFIAIFAHSRIFCNFGLRTIKIVTWIKVRTHAYAGPPSPDTRENDTRTLEHAYLDLSIARL